MRIPRDFNPNTISRMIFKFYRVFLASIKIEDAIASPFLADDGKSLWRIMPVLIGMGVFPRRTASLNGSLSHFNDGEKMNFRESRNRIGEQDEGSYQNSRFP